MECFIRLSRRLVFSSGCFFLPCDIHISLTCPLSFVYSLSRRSVIENTVLFRHVAPAHWWAYFISGMLQAVEIEGGLEMQVTRSHYLSFN